MDTVLWGGLAFLLAVGAMFLAMGRIDRSQLPDRTRRLVNYALLAGIVILAIVIFQWHSNSYLAAGA
ncbi:diguanylate cyclase [Alphaproteobacteria bacterium]|nr:diguanylate cyclase [Alphaproteobacteria bacterium]